MTTCIDNFYLPSCSDCFLKIKFSLNLSNNSRKSTKYEGGAKNMTGQSEP